jgi:hypothetical protein
LEKGNERQLSGLPVDFSGGSVQSPARWSARALLGMQWRDFHPSSNWTEHARLVERMDAERGR